MPVKDYVEFHDATVERISLTADRLEVHFSHLAVYKEEAPSRFGVWGAKAVLIAQGIRSLAIIGAVAREHDHVSVGDVWREGATVVDVVDLAAVPDGTIELLFTQSAARLHCRAEKVGLEIVHDGRRIESYSDE